MWWKSSAQGRGSISSEQSERGGRQFCHRCEQAGETLFCYTEAPEKVVAELEANNRKAAGLRYLHRPANLEDVFLKLTGRDLRD
jgi:lipooligosaccharide transport system ATP-binding protein